MWVKIQRSGHKAELKDDYLEVLPKYVFPLLWCCKHVKTSCSLPDCHALSLEASLSFEEAHNRFLRRKGLYWTIISQWKKKIKGNELIFLI